MLAYAIQELKKIEGFRLIGNAPKKASVISFILDNIHPYDIGMILDKLGIAVRTGHHCAQPVMDAFAFQEQFVHLSLFTIPKRMLIDWLME